RSSMVPLLLGFIMAAGLVGAQKGASVDPDAKGVAGRGEPAAGKEASTAGNQETQDSQAATESRRRPAPIQSGTSTKKSPSQSQPAASRPRQQPSAQQRQPTSQRQPTTQTARRQRPPTPATPPIKVYSAGELKTMAADITSFSDQLTALNRQTARRLSRFAPSDSVPEVRRYRFAGDYRLWRQLVRQYEDHPEDQATLVALADLQRRNHKFKEAETYLLKALAVEPLNQELLFNLAHSYLKNGENTKAWGAFQEIVYLNPESIEARLFRGWVRENEGNFKGAMVIYAQVEEQFGAVAGVYFHRALNLVKRGEYGDAVALAREGLALYPDHAPLYYARGKAYTGLGLLDRAKTDFYDALSLDADFLEAYACLGEVSLQEGNATTAIRAYLRLLDSQPGDAAASLNLGRAYLMDLRFKEAIQEWEMLRYLRPENRAVLHWLPQAYYLYSFELKARGRFREALEAYHKAMSLSREQASGWMVSALVLAGNAARAHDDYQRSIDYYTMAINNDPFQADAYVGLSRTYGALRDSTRATSALQRALAIDPDHPAARAELGRLSLP
ncbi:MAG: tetratricopeptide repeat protein, partial [Candidatus Neomarinimicrobiota bacterium]